VTAQGWEIELRVNGTPTGKGRPRFNTRTGHAHTPAQTRVAEARVIAAWHQAGSPRLPEGAAVLTVEMALARPGGHWKVDGTLSAAGQRSQWPTKKPDADNVLKLVMDSLNGAAYRDDAQIVHAWVVKRWCNTNEHEHTLVRLRPAPVPTLAAVRSAA
jgi:Holliday junction resolvase RusA-like endonuclease